MVIKGKINEAFPLKQKEQNCEAETGKNIGQFQNKMTSCLRSSSGGCPDNSCSCAQVHGFWADQVKSATRSAIIISPSISVTALCRNVLKWLHWSRFLCFDSGQHRGETKLSLVRKSSWPLTFACSANPSNHVHINSKLKFGWPCKFKAPKSLSRSCMRVHQVWSCLALNEHLL